MAEPIKWGALDEKMQKRVTAVFALVVGDNEELDYPTLQNAVGGDADGKAKKIHKKMDYDDDGKVFAHEWAKFWVKLAKAKGEKVSKKMLKELASQIQANANAGHAEECEALSESNQALLKDLLLIIDDSGAGQVTTDELQDVLGDEADKTMMLDIDGDGTVTYEEMCTVMGQMKAKKGEDCVTYYIKHLMTLVEGRDKTKTKKAKKASSGGWFNSAKDTDAAACEHGKPGDEQCNRCSVMEVRRKFPHMCDTLCEHGRRTDFCKECP